MTGQIGQLQTLKDARADGMRNWVESRGRPLLQLRP